MTYDSATNQVWIRDLYVTNQEAKRRVSLSFRFGAWTEMPDGTINNLYLFPERAQSDPLNLGHEQGERLDLTFDVSGDVGEGPTGFTLSVLDRVTSKMIFVAPFPSFYPPSLRDREKPRKIQRA